MKVTDKIVKFRIQPYIQEVSLQFIIDLIVSVLVTVVFVVADFPVVACVIFDLLYFTVAVIFHYKTLIQAILDKSKRDFVTENKEMWGNKKVFVIATMGLFSGDGAGILGRLLESCGAEVIGGLHLKMPDSIADEKTDYS